MTDSRDHIHRLRGKWRYTGQERPDFALVPGPGQESVWDYPRPPALVACDRLVEIKSGSTLIARSNRAKRVLETASPPTIYIPPDDIDFEQLTRAPGSSTQTARRFSSTTRLTGEPVRTVKLGRFIAGRT